jgi:hypothetical protein
MSHKCASYRLVEVLFVLRSRNKGLINFLLFQIICNLGPFEIIQVSLELWIIYLLFCYIIQLKQGRNGSSLRFCIGKNRFGYAIVPVLRRICFISEIHVIHTSMLVYRSKIELSDLAKLLDNMPKTRELRLFGKFIEKRFLLPWRTLSNFGRSIVPLKKFISSFVHIHILFVKRVWT